MLQRVRPDAFVVVKDFILRLYRQEKQSASPKLPIVVGISGPQGCGKTTLCNKIERVLSAPPHSLSVVSLSTDDLYLPFEQQQALARANPSNPLWQQRGNAGTHDVELGERTLRAFKQLNSATNDSTRVIHLPRYDKSLHGGKGDQLPRSQWPAVSQPLDIVLFEGWQVGLPALTANELEQIYSNPPTRNLPGRLAHVDKAVVHAINEKSMQYQVCWYDQLDALVLIQADDLNNVYDWRWQQEQALHDQITAESGQKGDSTSAVAKRGAMTREMVDIFVDRFMPAYELHLPKLYRDGFRRTQDIKDGTLCPQLMIVLNKNRDVVCIEEREREQQRGKGREQGNDCGRSRL